jgi:hypothetical protein
MLPYRIVPALDELNTNLTNIEAIEEDIIRLSEEKKDLKKKQPELLSRVVEQIEPGDKENVAFDLYWNWRCLQAKDIAKAFFGCSAQKLARKIKKCRTRKACQECGKEIVVENRDTRIDFGKEQKQEE